ncbi:MAG TPA: hypothetical protein VGH36_08380 [Acetobacteraceae bacterium]|jgi:hypothetical protein
MIWLLAGFVFLVHWLMGYQLARFGMFAVMTAAICYAVSQLETQPSFVPPDIFFGTLVCWFVSGIPRRVIRRSNASAAVPSWVEQVERQRLAGREIRSWR